MDMPRLAVAHPNRMSWPTQKQRTLILADDSQNEPTQGILSATGGRAIAFQKFGIDLICRFAHRRSEGPGRLIEGACRIIGQLHEFGFGKRGVARQHEIDDEVIAFAAAGGLAWWGKSQQAGHLSGLLSVTSMNGKDIQVKWCHSVRMLKRLPSLYW